MPKSTRKNRLYKFIKSLSTVFSNLGYFGQIIYGKIKKGDKNGISIFLLSPPRAGSTLVYQFLLNNMQVYYFANFNNFFYTIPSWAIYSKKFQKRKINYYSNTGFVGGLWGPAEGLPIYSYWLKNGLSVDNTDRLLSKKDRFFSKIVTGYKKPFVAAYLGHVLTIEKLKELFPRSIFIHLTRDYTDNATSLLRYYNNTHEDYLFSTNPFRNHEMRNHDPKEKVAHQIVQIHDLIEQSKDDRFIEITYHDFCRDPFSLIQMISDKSESLYNYKITLTKSSQNSFTKKEYDKDSALSKELESIFRKTKSKIE